MKKPSLIGGLLFAGGAAVLIAICLAVPDAGISRVEAGELALEQFSEGVIEDTELIRENGRLVWCVRVRPVVHSHVSQIFIDAKIRDLVFLKSAAPGHRTWQSQSGGNEDSQHSARAN